MIFFGHNPKFVREAVDAQYDKGIEIGPQTPLAGEVAKLVCDMVGKRYPGGRVVSMGVLCLISTAVLGAAFGLPLLGVQLSNQAQFALFAVGGFFATCTAGPSAAIVMNVVHPGFRATGASILGLLQNLLGMAMGPLIGGVLSDAFGLQTALAVTPLFGIV